MREPRSQRGSQVVGGGGGCWGVQEKERRKKKKEKGATDKRSGAREKGCDKKGWSRELVVEIVE